MLRLSFLAGAMAMLARPSPTAIHPPVRGGKTVSAVGPMIALRYAGLVNHPGAIVFDLPDAGGSRA